MLAGAERRGGRFAREEREPTRTGVSHDVKQAFAGVRWYLREVSGESAYDRYVEHMRRDHPGPAGDVAPRLRALAPGRARREPSRALLLSGRNRGRRGPGSSSGCKNEP